MIIKLFVSHIAPWLLKMGQNYGAKKTQGVNRKLKNQKLWNQENTGCEQKVEKSTFLSYFFFIASFCFRLFNILCTQSFKVRHLPLIWGIEI